MTESLGSDLEQVIKNLSAHGVSMSYVKQAVADLTEKGASFTVFNAVDALTRIAGRLKNAGERSPRYANRFPAIVGKLAMDPNAA
ncbi:MAG: hypothetical protein R3C56_42410 [Pirellulaceae bacterium]